MKKAQQIRRVRGIIAGLASLLFLSGCTSVPKPSTLPTPEQLLPDAALLYARFDSAALDKLLPSLMAAGQDDAARQSAGQNLSPLTERTDYMVAAIMPQSSPKQTPALYAVASGNFPIRLINLALGLDKGWKRQAQTWHHQASGMTVQAIGGTMLLIGSAGIEPLITNLSASRSSPIPERWHSDWQSNLAVYMPEPLYRLASSLSLPNIEIPLGAIFITGLAQTDSSYRMKLLFDFDTPRSALMFSPICRLLFYGMAHRFWPLRAASILDAAIWRTDAAVVSAGNFDLQADELAALLRLAQ